VTGALAIGPQPIDYAPYNAWSAYWASVVSFFVFVLFLPPELYAIATGHPENTLSAQFWRLGDVVANQPISQWAPEHWAMAIAVTALFGWLIPHFVLGILR
jgi:hypothetical protein